MRVFIGCGYNDRDQWIERDVFRYQLYSAQRLLLFCSFWAQTTPNSYKQFARFFVAGYIPMPLIKRGFNVTL
jgi:hypothetical protein